jgi:hypothetical protein
MIARWSCFVLGSYPVCPATTDEADIERHRQHNRPVS